MSTASDRMILIGFLQAQNCSNYPGAWRHPAATGDFMTPQYYQRIARTLEDAKFDMAFFDDRLAMPEIYSESHDMAVRHGIRTVKMDPSTILMAMAMAMATNRLGLGATYSTTYYEPFHVARVFQTLDLMSGGRTAWNIVTSLNDSEAANFGRELHLSHDERYDRADEFVELTCSPTATEPQLSVVLRWIAWSRSRMRPTCTSGPQSRSALAEAVAFSALLIPVSCTRRMSATRCSASPNAAFTRCCGPMTSSRNCTGT